MTPTQTFITLRRAYRRGQCWDLLFIIFNVHNWLPETDNNLSATFADDTVALSCHQNPSMASQNLQTHLDKVNKWMKTWRIKASANKSTHVTFTLRQGNCPPVKLGEDSLPHNDKAKYLGIHLDRKQIWRTHIEKKRDELNHRFRSLQWLLGRQSKLSINNKILIYKTIIKPVWTYGIELWGSAKNSNIEILQRFQNHALKTISNAPWFTKIDEVHKYVEIPTVKQEVERLSKSYKERLNVHMNSLAMALSEPIEIRRLKRQHIWDLVPE